VTDPAEQSNQEALFSDFGREFLQVRGKIQLRSNCLEVEELLKVAPCMVLNYSTSFPARFFNTS
jgi:hypothetical protein